MSARERASEGWLVLLACLTVAIKRRAERRSHGDKPHTLVFERALPDAEVIGLGPHQRRATFGSGSWHLLVIGSGSLDHFSIGF